MTEARNLGEMSEQDFGRIVELARREAGIELPASKIAMIQSRVFRHMRRTGFKDGISRFIDEIVSDEARRQEMVSVLTTNVTGFFREAHHFDTLGDLLKGLASDKSARLRIWSAGCSAGHEPYSIAMVCRDILPDFAERDLKILATDIDLEVLEQAKKGIYSASDVEKMGAARLNQHFRQEGSHDRPLYRVTDELRRAISFRTLNLHSDWPMKGPFDAIFCRNVVIYFSDEGRARLWPRFHDILAPGGLLFIGHSERIHPLTGGMFEAAGITTFRKAAA